MDIDVLHRRVLDIHDRLTKLESAPPPAAASALPEGHVAVEKSLFDEIKLVVQVASDIPEVLKIIETVHEQKAQLEKLAADVSAVVSDLALLRVAIATGPADAPADAIEQQPADAGPGAAAAHNEGGETAEGAPQEPGAGGA